MKTDDSKKTSAQRSINFGSSWDFSYSLPIKVSVLQTNDSY